VWELFSSANRVSVDRAGPLAWTPSLDLAARLFGRAEECVRKLPLFRLRARCQA
jgi:hypothetical protein